MEVRIGVVDTPKELTVDIDAKKADELVANVESAVSGKAPVLWLTDEDGKRVGVPADKVAYVEFIVEDENRRVGFGKA